MDGASSLCPRKGCSAPMSIPCTFFNPDSSNLPVGKTSLQDADSGLLASCPAAPKDSSATFDRVLNEVDETPSEPLQEEKDADSPTRATASSSLTPEQLALMASMVFPNPTQLPLPPPAAPEGSSSLELLGAEGRSIPELLVRGAEVLEYQVSPLSNEGASTSSSAVLAEGAPAQATPPPQASGVKGLSPTSVPALETPNPASDSRMSSVSLGALPSLKDAGAWSGRPLRFSENPLASQLGSTGSTDLTPPAAASTLFLTPPSPTSTGLTGDQSISPPGESSGDPEAASEDSRNKNSDTAGSALSADASSTSPAGAVSATNLHSIAANLPRPRAGGSERPVKSAGSAGSIRPAGDKSPSVRGKNASLLADEEKVGKSADEVGTIAANWGKTMYQETRNFPSVSAQSDASSFGGLLRSEHKTTGEEATQVAPAHAPDLVHEIREIADGLWAVERNSVEVKFNFGEQEPLSVRVEYRDGTVQATFRTDSSDLRDAITREWQARSGQTEQRPYRVADPVFTTTAQPTSGFSFGGDASRQQRSPEQQPQSGSFDRLTLGSLSRSAPSTTISSALPSSPRETTGRLHALV